jgi:tRNA A-37 threonylcarbamoyl transferase component Bud32
MALSLLWLIGWLALAAGCWLLVARSPRRGRLRLHPSAGWLFPLGLSRVEDFLALEALVISGHPGRQVLRLTLRDRVVFLKKQQKVRWSERLRNLLTGHGWVSNSLREARTLAELERCGLPAPRWLAAGEDSGRAFLLIEGVEDAVPLSQAIKDISTPERRDLARRVGRELARLHAAGFCHRDLYAKHVLIGSAGTITLLDWQRAGRATSRGIVRDLAALDATVPEELAGPRDRCALIRAYVGSTKDYFGSLVRAVQRESARLLRYRHVREKRQGSIADQAWICLEGEALCVTPTFVAMCPDPAGWLDLDRHPLPREKVLIRRWLTLPTGGRALLVRERKRDAGLHQQSMLLWRLERHGVTAPRVLAVGRRRHDCFLLVEPLTNTVRLNVWLRRRSADRRALIVHSVGELVARMHEGCCYLGKAGVACLAVRISEGNVIVDNVEGITPLRRPDRRRARADLAALRRLLLGSGCSEQEWQTCERRYSGRFWETSRNGDRPSLWHRLTRGWCRVRHRADWSGFVGEDWRSNIMDRPVTDRFFAKQGRSTGRLVLDSSAGRLAVYLKRHHHLSLVRRLLALVWPDGDWSPAMQEFNHLQWARKHGIFVPRAVAAGEFIGPGLRLRSFLAVEELTGMLPLNEAIPRASRRLTPTEFLIWKRGLVAELARVARLLHDRRHFHKDLYLCHFFVHEDDIARAPHDWRGRVWLIDLHRLAHHPRTATLWVVKDLAQLLYSSDVPGVTARDRAAFWRHYRAGAPGMIWNWLAAAIRFKWRRYQRHNRKRQAKA